MSSTARTVAKGFAAVFVILCMAGWLRQTAPRAPVPVTALGNTELCEAWHVNKSAALTTELKRRGLLSHAELAAASGGRVTIGMSYMATVCALGYTDEHSTVTTSHGLTSTSVYRREGARPLIVRFDNGSVDAVAD